MKRTLWALAWRAARAINSGQTIGGGELTVLLAYDAEGLLQLAVATWRQRAIPPARF